MLRYLCCSVKETTAGSNSHKEKRVQREKLVSSGSGTAKHQKKEAAYRLRSLSASDDKYSPQKSRGRVLEDILEDETRSTSLPRNYPNDATPKNQSLFTSTGGSSESVYKTPPTSRHASASSHPLSTMQSVSTLKFSSLTRETVPPREKRSSQALLFKIDEAEQKRHKQHKELLNVIANFTIKLDNVVSEVKGKRSGSERDVSTDGVRKSPLTPKELGGSIKGSLLPQNTPVSSEVILKLSKRVSTPQWKFLGRWLKIPDHEINTISANFKEDIQEQSYQMLLKWRESSGGGSYQELGEALRTEFGEKLYSDFLKMVIESEGTETLVSNSQ